MEPNVVPHNVVPSAALPSAGWQTCICSECPKSQRTRSRSDMKQKFHVFLGKTRTKRRTKPVPMERVLSPENFDMRLETKHLRVPELLVQWFQWFWQFFI